MGPKLPAGNTLRAVLLTIAVGAVPFATAHAERSTNYYFVANTSPPDAYLALRSAPSSVVGNRIEAMPNGTLLDVLEQRPDGWWLVKNIRTGHQGWALSGNATTNWIACCASVDEPGQQTNIEEGFKMPSNHVFCRSFDLGSEQRPEPALRCDINNLQAFPPRPPDCDLEWGDAFEVSASDALGTRVCHGDTAVDEALPVLRYGTVWNHRGLTCTSETTGLTCLNSYGHGFRLSRAVQEVF